MKSYLYKFCAALIFTTTLFFKVDAQSIQLKEADSLFQLKDWKAAEKIYAGALKDTSTNALELNRLGLCNYNLGLYDAALKNYRRALAGKPSTFLKGLVEERIARIYGKTNKPDSALKWLNTAAISGLSIITEIDTLSELKALHGLAEYGNIYQKNICACISLHNHAPYPRF